MRLSPDMTEDVVDGRPERGRAFSGLLLIWDAVMLAQLSTNIILLFYATWCNDPKFLDRHVWRTVQTQI